MTIGIYVLKFIGTTKVYIGQSTNIENRFSQHMYNFINNKASKKLQEAYIIYGKPTLEIIVECYSKDLDKLELQYIIEYNSVTNGFNTNEYPDSAPILLGELHGRSKCTNSKVEEAFNLLIDTNIPFIEVSEITGVPFSSIKHIADGSIHVWLKDKYPTRYIELMSKKGRRNGYNRSIASKGITYPAIISPEGDEYFVENISKFAREHNLKDEALGNVLKGNNLSTKGWYLSTNRNMIFYPQVISSEGILYSIRRGKATEFAVFNELSPSSFSKLLNKKLKSLKGWKLVEA